MSRGQPQGCNALLTSRRGSKPSFQQDTTVAHNITSTDTALFHKTPAWHGIGTVVPEALTPKEALQVCGLGWRVVEQPLRRMAPTEDGNGLMSVEVKSHKAIVREDNGHQLGIVGEGWTPIQNEELADLAESVNQDGIVKVESCGSLGGGSKVWFLLKGESIFVTERDESKPYVMIANGHGGTLSLTVQATSIRVQCENTLSMVLGNKSERSIRYVHSRGIKYSIPEIQQAIGMFMESRKKYEEQAKAMRAKKMTAKSMQEFWIDVYTNVLGLQIPTLADAKEDPTKRYVRDQALQRVSRWKGNYDVEIDQRGNVPSVWAAFNAVTEEFAESEKGDKASELFGSKAKRRTDVFKAALALV